MNQYTGTFFSNELGVTWTFVVADGALNVVEDPEQMPLPVWGPVAPGNTADSFFGASGLLQFTRDASGAVSGVNVSFLGMKDFRFVRQQAASASRFGYKLIMNATVPDTAQSQSEGAPRRL